jgi:SAM-dependent methyltransferase
MDKSDKARNKNSRRGIITAAPNPTSPPDLAWLARTTISWQAEGVDLVEVHIHAPNGPLFTRGGSTGSAETGKWVRDGMKFFLQDVTDGRSLTLDNTLATVSVSVNEDRSTKPKNRTAVDWLLRPGVVKRLRAHLGGKHYCPAPGWVEFGSLRRLSPLSPNYGIERGLPVTRYYIERFLERHSHDVRGRVLEIDDDRYTRRYGGDRVIHSDVLHAVEGNAQATIVADLSDAPQIATSTYDCVIFTQTLLLIYDTRAAIETLHRILKPGGVLLATFPGVAHKIVLSEDWEDYWRLTTMSARRLFGDIFSPELVEVEGHGNVLTAVAALVGLAADELTVEELEHRDPEFEVLVSLRAVRA